MGKILELPHVLKTRQSPARLSNAELRPLEYLEDEEVERLIKAATKLGRHPIRDSLMIRMAAKHGYRASELCALRWVHLDFNSRNPKVKVIRLKGSEDSTHFLNREELIALKKVRDRYPGSPYVFGHERGSKLSPAFWKIVKRAGTVAGFEFPIHPHAAPPLRLPAHQREPRYPLGAGLHGPHETRERPDPRCHLICFGISSRHHAPPLLAAVTRR